MLASTDGTQPDAVHKHNAPNQREHYRVRSVSNETSQALVVKAFNDDKIQIKSDTQTDPDFNFFTDQQRNYLRSMVACPLRLGPGETTFGVFAVDANVAGYFQPERAEIEQIVLLADEIALRLSLELAMLEYMEKRINTENKGVTDGSEDPCV